MSAPYELEIKRACDGDTLDQTRAFEICDKVAVEGSEGAQQLAQAVIARFNLYPDISEKARLLDLVDILVVNCDQTFHLHLAEEGFFQTLISDRRVQSDQQFRTNVQAHLTAWLDSLSEKALGIASDVLGRLSGSSEAGPPTEPQSGSSNPRGPSDQLLNRGPREVITFRTPKLEKRLCRFLLSSYVQAGDIVRTSRRVRWFSLQAIHIARQAFHLIIRFNDFIGPDGPTEEQYDEGLDLDDALEELEDKLDELEKLELDEAILSEDNHKYDLARLYQIFFSTRDYYLNGRDYTTDPVLRRLANSDHVSLLLARRLQARGPDTEGFQIIDVHNDDDDDGSNHGHISDVSASQTGPDDTETVQARSTDSAPPPTEEQQVSTSTPTSGENVGNVVLIEPQSQEAAEGTQTTTLEGQQQEGITEAVTEETEDQDQDIQAAIAESLGTTLPTRSRDDDDDDSQPDHQFKCTVPGCGRKFSEHHELKAHTHEHDDKPYKCVFKECTKTYSTERERDRHVSIHRLTRQFGLPSFDPPGGTTTTETAAVGSTSVTQAQATGALPSVFISTSSPSSTNPPDAPVVGSPAQA